MQVARNDVAQRVGMQEVARRAKVAASSVSRVLSGHPDVSPAMRERVLSAVVELGYQPDFLAQSLRRGASLSIAFIVADISNPLLASIALGAEKVLRSAGYSMLLTNSGSDPELDVAHIRLFLHRRVDGLILSLASERRKAIVDLLADSQVPTVVVDRQLPARARASAVFSDHRTGMLAAANALLDLGHRKIGLVSAPLDILAGRMRLAALREAVAARGLPEDAVMVVAGPFTHEHGRAGTMALLDSPHGAPTALIAGSNQLLSGCLEALQARQLRPGTDVAVIACDDTPLARLYQPPIATITRDTVALGHAAAVLLLRRLRPSLPGDADPATVVLDTEFVERASCCPPPAGD
jgi:LacI family transcriptional regulator, galactose operon repressor